MCVNSNGIDAQKTNQGKRKTPSVGGGVEPNSPRKALRFIKQSSLSIKQSFPELKWAQMNPNELQRAWMSLNLPNELQTAWMSLNQSKWIQMIPDKLKWA